MGLSRRTFFAGLTAAPGLALANPEQWAGNVRRWWGEQAQPGFGVDRYAGIGEHLDLPPADPLVHLLNRSSFGLRREDLERARLLGAEAWLESQMAPETIEDAECEAEILFGFRALSTLPRKALIYHYSNRPAELPRQAEPLMTAANAVFGETSRSLQDASGEELPNEIDTRATVTSTMNAARDLQGATVYRALWSNRQLHEVMVEFWSNHFAIDVAASSTIAVHKILDDREVIRPHALSSFRELLLASARSTAMLHFLDGVSNIKGRPNENYARELFELHTLGVESFDQPGGYTEADIQAAARCFTGWTVDSLSQDFIFDPQRHDYGPKNVRGRDITGAHLADPLQLQSYRLDKWQTPALDQGLGGGISDGLQVLEDLISDRRTARFIARKLVRRFVQDEPPADLVERVADAYMLPVNGLVVGDIKSMLRVIFHSPEFWQAGDRKFKRPFEMLVSAARATGALVKRDRRNQLITLMQAVGQLPHAWPDPDGYPDEAGFWLSSDGILQRWLLCSQLGNGEANAAIYTDPASLRGEARSPRELVEALQTRILHRELSPADREHLEAFAAQSADPQQALSDPALDSATRGLLALLLCSPYFQLR